MFDMPAGYLTPYILSNVVALALFFGAVWRPNVVRVAFALIFLVASAVNTYTALVEPTVYLDYAELAVTDAYREFITGPFAEIIVPFLLAIALGQLACSILLFLGGRAARIGALGAAIFLLAIAPLGVGSAFPFSVIAVAALAAMDWRLRHPTDTDAEREDERERQRRMPLVSGNSD